MQLQLQLLLHYLRVCHRTHTIYLYAWADAGKHNNFINGRNINVPVLPADWLIMVKWLAGQLPPPC